MSALGDAIRTARKAKNYTQKQLGARFGITRNAVSMWESGVNVPEPEKLRRLQTMLDLPSEVAIQARDAHTVR